MRILGVDVGGTYTDAVLVEDGQVRTTKVPTAAAQEESVLAAAHATGATEAALDRFTHGTTVATNALLERRGARTAFVATEGFEHLLHLRRQDRAHLYRLCAAHPEPLVPVARCVGVRERMGPQEVVVPLDLATLPPLDDVQAIAVCLLHAYADPAHERAVSTELRRRHPDAHVVASHEVAPEIREYERASTTVVDAYLGPVLGGYLGRLRAAAVGVGTARAARHALIGRRGHAAGGRRTPRLGTALRPGGRSRRRGVCREPRGLRGRDRIRHGRDVDRRVRHRRR